MSRLHVFFALVFLGLMTLGAARAQSIAITLAPDPAQDGRWIAAYEVERPVDALHFTRVAGDRRAPVWRSLDPDIALRHITGTGGRDGRDVVRRTGGGLFQAARFAMPAIYEALPKDYAPFARFTDGGLLIHSGRFHVCPSARACDGWRVTVRPPEGAGVLVHGRWHEGEAVFLSEGSGTFIYVGARKPTEGGSYWSVVDPGFPASARKTLDDLFPKLMALYAERLGAPARKPMLFASVDFTDVDGRTHSQGGTLPDQVMIHLQGPVWATPERDYAWLPWFYAHEAAHLHQTRLDIRAEDSWFHEGAAEALAHTALDMLGAAPPSYLGARRRAAFHACARFLSEHALRDAAREGAFQRYYDCGMHMHFAAAAAFERAGHGDFFDYLRMIEARARSRPGGGYDAESFYDAVAEFGDAETAAFLRAMVEEAHPEASAVFLRDGLIAAGVDHQGAD